MNYSSQTPHYLSPIISYHFLTTHPFAFDGCQTISRQLSNSRLTAVKRKLRNGLGKPAGDKKKKPMLTGKISNKEY